MHKRHRYYDPSTGEFINRDPLEYVDGMSLYRAYFVPRAVDPFGLARRVGKDENGNGIFQATGHCDAVIGGGLLGGSIWGSCVLYGDCYQVINGITVSVACPPGTEIPGTLPTSGSEPVYNPDIYNDGDPLIGVRGGKNQLGTNCIGYGCDKIEIGRPTTKYGNYRRVLKDDEITCTKVKAGFLETGYTAVGRDEKCPCGSWKVAVFIIKGVDVHIVRQDSSGLFSHKPGDGHVIKTDNSGDHIVDPESADFGKYKFCAYLCVPPKKSEKQE